MPRLLPSTSFPFFICHVIIQQYRVGDTHGIIIQITTKHKRWIKNMSTSRHISFWYLNKCEWQSIYHTPTNINTIYIFISTTWGVSMKLPELFYCKYSCTLIQLTKWGHIQHSALEQPYTQPNNIASAGNICGTPLSKEPSLLLSHLSECLQCPGL